MAVPVGQRNVPDNLQNQKFDAVYQAMCLASHTILLCKNKNIFKPEINETIINDLVETAKNIYLEAYGANEIRVKHLENWKRREEKEARAIDLCTRLLSLINLARHVFHLRGKKVLYWQRMATTTKSYLMVWYQSEVKRFEYLYYENRT